MTKNIPRNSAALSAKLRHAGPMKNIRPQPDKDPSRWKDLLDLTRLMGRYQDQELTFQEFGAEVAEAITMCHNFEKDSVLKEISWALGKVDSEEKLAFLLQELLSWGAHNYRCQVILHDE